MGYKKNYVCCACQSEYTIKQIEKSGIFSIDGDTFWVCPKCNDFNEFFNFEKVYMPIITKLDE